MSPVLTFERGAVAVNQCTFHARVTELALQVFSSPDTELEQLSWGSFTPGAPLTLGHDLDAKNLDLE